MLNPAVMVFNYINAFSRLDSRTILLAAVFVWLHDIYRDIIYFVDTKKDTFSIKLEQNSHSFPAFIMLTRMSNFDHSDPKLEFTYVYFLSLPEPATAQG